MIDLFGRRANEKMDDLQKEVNRLRNIVEPPKERVMAKPGDKLVDQNRKIWTAGMYASPSDPITCYRECSCHYCQAMSHGKWSKNFILMSRTRIKAVSREDS